MFGFKASLNFINGVRRQNRTAHDDISAVVSVTGAYRSNKSEFTAYSNSDAQRKSTPNLTPTTVPEPPKRPLRAAKSTSDLGKHQNLPPAVPQESPGVSMDPRGAEQVRQPPNRPQVNNIPNDKRLDAQVKIDKQRLAEQKKIEKQRIEEQKKFEKQQKKQIAEQKKREKLALKEQAKQEKLRKEREKKEAQQAKTKKKLVRQFPPANPLGQPTAGQSNPLANGSGQQSTNTLESSISKSSGPPPYTASKPEGERDKSGNVIYTRPEETDSWDLVSKHRANIARPVTAGPTKQTKQTVMDLNYKTDETNRNEKSEA